MTVLSPNNSTNKIIIQNFVNKTLVEAEKVDYSDYDYDYYFDYCQNPTLTQLNSTQLKATRVEVRLSSHLKQ